MLDSYNREISYLRISVTDRCNLRCLYCMPEEGVELKKHSECLSFEALAEIAREAASLGITKIRLTGGEPLVRRGIAGLVRMLKQTEGIELVAMTTNGHLLNKMAAELKEAGLDSLNISLDTLNARRYSTLTRGGDIRKVLEGIEAARNEGFPLKINMVISEETKTEEIEELKDFCDSKGIKLQKIREYALAEDKETDEDIIYQRPPPCSKCNRIRLLSDGKLKPCLHSDREIPVDTEHIKECLIQTIKSKPACGGSCTNRNMVEIGG